MTTPVDPVQSSLLHGAITIEKTKDLSVAMDQYRLFVDTMEKVVERRQTVGNFFLSVNALFVTGIGFFAKELGGAPITLLGVAITASAGILVCLTWRGLMRYYGLLNTAKFAVIHAMEQHLPFASFAAEWEALGKGLDSSRYVSFAKIEKKIPMIFTGVYVTVLIVAVAYVVIT